MTRPPLPASFFGIVLGLCGLGQAWRVAVLLWNMPSWPGETILALAAMVWSMLLVLYLAQAVRARLLFENELRHPVHGATPALLAISTMLMALAVLPYSRACALVLAATGIALHLAFSLWHTGTLWQGARAPHDTAPTLYLPTAAGNFISGAALGALGHADWGWLFLGAGLFSWLALESQVVQRLWQGDGLPVPQRPLLGIQYAPPVVCAMSAQLLVPGSTAPWLLMLWGYGLYQLLLVLRLRRWLRAQPFAPSYWSYTFGLAAATICCLKLALAGFAPAAQLAPLLFGGANLLIGWLALRTLHLLFTRRLLVRPA